jgi:hypothetical protein
MSKRKSFKTSDTDNAVRPSQPAMTAHTSSQSHSSMDTASAQDAAIPKVPPPSLNKSVGSEQNFRPHRPIPPSPTQSLLSDLYQWPVFFAILPPILSLYYGGKIGEWSEGFMLVVIAFYLYGLIKGQCPRGELIMSNGSSWISYSITCPTHYAHVLRHIIHVLQCLGNCTSLLDSDIVLSTRWPRPTHFPHSNQQPPPISVRMSRTISRHRTNTLLKLFDIGPPLGCVYWNGSILLWFLLRRWAVPSSFDIFVPIFVSTRTWSMNFPWLYTSSLPTFDPLPI